MPDADYWESVALWMGDILAATAEHQISLKSVGANEKKRQARIATMAADALEGKNRPSPRSASVIVQRLRSVEH